MFASLNALGTVQLQLFITSALQCNGYDRAVGDTDTVQIATKLDILAGIDLDVPPFHEKSFAIGSEQLRRLVDR